MSDYYQEDIYEDEAEELLPFAYLVVRLYYEQGFKGAISSTSDEKIIGVFSELEKAEKVAEKEAKKLKKTGECVEVLAVCDNWTYWDGELLRNKVIPRE